MAVRDISAFLNLVDYRLKRPKPGKIRNRVELAGVELEGGWKKLPEGAALTHDGSVRIPEETEVRQDGQIRNVTISTGELPSDPMEVTKIAPWMRKFYPSHVNETCGLHVHMSFESALHYQRLMVVDYQDTIVEYLERWGKEEGLPESHLLFQRLKGTNEYCQRKFWPDLQARRKKSFDRRQEGHRYTIINYCYSEHCDLECRVLPMFPEVEQGIRAVMRVIDITNAFLARGGSEEKLKGEVPAPPPLALGDERREYL